MSSTQLSPSSTLLMSQSRTSVLEEEFHRAPEPLDEELLLKWDDHHKSFFDLAEDLAHQEQFIDVTLSCGDHNFPAHKLILSVCSPYFRHLFLRNPCKHPIVVLKDVHFKYMKLLLMYMYRGEVSCPQEDLHGLLRTARSLQIRGLVELERKREAEGCLSNSLTGSPIKRLPESGSVASVDEEFSIDDVRSRLHGQLEIQPIARPSSNSTPSWTHRSSISSTNEQAVPSESSLEDRIKQRIDSSLWDSNGMDHRPSSNPSIGTLSITPQTVPASRSSLGKRSSSRDSTSSVNNHNNNNNSAAILAAVQAVGMPANALDPSDPMASMNALLAAAQAQQHQSTTTSTASLSNTALNSRVTPISTTATSSSGTTNGGNQGVDLSQAAAMANLQLYYYMQKVATAGMGNPKERKECHVCGKTLYDRSTWNRHMRIHTGEKPYPCRFCGRRFRTNYNKLGHEKKCPDRHSLLGTPGATPTPPESTQTAVYR